MSSSPAEPRGASLPLAAITTTVWTVLVGTAPVIAIALVAWAADSRSTAPASDVLRFGLNTWLMAHGSPIHLSGGGTVGLAPLLLSGIIIWQLFRAGQATARAVGTRTREGIVRVAAAIAIAYLVCAVAASLYARTDDVHVTPWIAGPLCGALAFLAAGIGAVRESRIDRPMWALLPGWIREGIQAGAGAAALLLAIGALAMGAALIASAESARAMINLGNLGIVGGVALLILCILYAPTTAIWGTTYLVGAGFSFGEGTSISPTTLAVGPVPSFPLLAPIAEAPDGRIAYLSFLIPSTVGIVVGVLVGRRTRAYSWYKSIASVGVASLTSAMALGLCSIAASGPLGAEHLSAVGPSGWQVGLATFGELSICGLLGWAVPALLSAAEPAPTPRSPGVSLGEPSSEFNYRKHPRSVREDPHQTGYSPHPDLQKD